MSSFHRFRTLKRSTIAHVPFLAAHHRVSAALHTKLPNAHRYPTVALALASAAVAIAAPLTATADSTAPVASTTQHAAVKHVAAKPTAKKAQSTHKSTATKTTAKAKSTPAKKAAAAKPAPAKKAAAATPVSTKPYAGVSYATLELTGTQGSQSRFTPSSAQWANATTIVKAAKDLNLSPYAATIGVATAIQESKLHNLHVAVDHDSLGLFQQRPSTGWGTPSELTNTTYAAKAFLRELPSGYKHMGLADAAQSVQRSFDGSLYAQWEAQAAYMVHTLAN